MGRLAGSDVADVLDGCLEGFLEGFLEECLESVKDRGSEDRGGDKHHHGSMEDVLEAF